MGVGEVMENGVKFFFQGDLKWEMLIFKFYFEVLIMFVISFDIKVQ